jgi:Leucine-rich repeat (LRR) protein
MTQVHSGFSIAQERITRELEERTGFLDLGRLGLTALPEELFRLQHLEWLNLGDGIVNKEIEWIWAASNIVPNNLQDDVGRLAELSHLRALSLSGIRLSSLEDLGRLKGLLWLFCSTNPLSDLTPLASLTSLQSLDCGSTQVSDLTPLTSLTRLQWLYCPRTQVSDLTPLASLAALSSLSCSGCRLTHVPEGFWDKPSLKELYLFEAKLPGIPTEVLSADHGTSCLDSLPICGIWKQVPRPSSTSS